MKKEKKKRIVIYGVDGATIVDVDVSDRVANAIWNILLEVT